MVPAGCFLNASSAGGVAFGATLLLMAGMLVLSAEAQAENKTQVQIARFFWSFIWQGNLKGFRIGLSEFNNLKRQLQAIVRLF